MRVVYSAAIDGHGGTHYVTQGHRAWRNTRYMTAAHNENLPFAIYSPRIRAEAAACTPPFSPPDIDWRDGLVVRAVNWLGDTCMTLPAVGQLRERIPADVKLTVVAPRSLTPLWSAVPGIDDIIALDDRRARGQAARQIRETGAGVALVLPNSFGSALDVAFKGIPSRVGRAGRGRRMLLTHCLPPWSPADREAQFHQVSGYFDLAAALAPIPRRPDPPPLRLPNWEETATALGVIPDNGQRWLLLAPGAAYGPAKQWPIDYFAEVAAQWRKKSGGIITVGTQRENILGEVIREAVPDSLNLCGKTSLPELMAVLRAADICLTNDSGTMHLAAALDRPGVALFGSTNAAATGPVGGRWIVLQNPLPCAPCFARTCHLPREKQYTCLRRISPAAALAALDFLLA